MISPVMPYIDIYRPFWAMQGQTIKIMPIIMMHGSDHVGGATRHVQSTLRGAAAVYLFYRHTVLIFTDIQLMSRSGDPHDQ